MKHDGIDGFVIEKCIRLKTLSSVPTLVIKLLIKLFIYINKDIYKAFNIQRYWLLI